MRTIITPVRLIFTFIISLFILSQTAIAQAPFSFLFEDAKITLGRNDCMRVRVENFTKVDSFAFGFTYDTSKFKFTEAHNIVLEEEIEFQETTNVDETLVSISYTNVESTEGETLNDGVNAFILCFDAVGTFEDVATIEITNLENGDPPMIFSEGIGYGVPDLNIQTANLIIEDFSPPTFSTPLYFEDANGRVDTLTIGYDVFATEGIDNAFEEVDILNESLSDFDVRFFAYDNYLEEDLPFTCEHMDFDLPDYLEDIAIYESKTSITRSGCAIAGSAYTFSIFTIPTMSSFPITIRWNKLDYYGCPPAVSWISELSRGEIIQGDWCPERINYDSISLSSQDSIVLEMPSFKTIARRDSTLAAVYYIYLTDFGNIGQVSVNQLPESNLNFYPNPTQDKLYLDTPDQNWQYQILNLQGQQMMQGKYQDYIQVEPLPSGIYFLQLEQDGNYYKSIKFVKE